MKLFELLQIRKVFSLETTKGSTQLKYKIAKLIKTTEDAAVFYQEEFSKIIEECAKKDSNGSIARLESGDIPLEDNMKAIFLEKTQELSNTEVEDISITFTIEELEPLELSIQDLIVLDKYITE